MVSFEMPSCPPDMHLQKPDRSVLDLCCLNMSSVRRIQGYLQMLNDSMIKSQLPGSDKWEYYVKAFKINERDTESFSILYGLQEQRTDEVEKTGTVDPRAPVIIAATPMFHYGYSIPQNIISAEAHSINPGLDNTGLGVPPNHGTGNTPAISRLATPALASQPKQASEHGNGQYNTLEYLEGEDFSNRSLLD